MLGLLTGICLALFFPVSVPVVKIFGDLFVKALKSVAPVLVFFLVMSALAKKPRGKGKSMGRVMTFYLSSTLLASIVGVTYSFLFPTALVLNLPADHSAAPPEGIREVILHLLMSIIDNPVNAILTANYISILAWAVIFGLAIRAMGNEGLNTLLEDTSKAVTTVVTWIIRLAPLGIMGLVADSIGSAGLSALLGYIRLLAVLLGGYASVALIVNPLIVFSRARINPYPLIFRAFRESGVYAFFTRSSAANIPVNLALCRKMGLNPDLYTISIPLGAAVNTAGAAVTISTFSLAAAHTLGVPVDLPTALFLCIIAAVGASGSSGVAGGSLLLIPVACASFGIPNDISMQVVGVGFIVSVLEDSCETALNSSSDVVFTAAAELEQRRRSASL